MLVLEEFPESGGLPYQATTDADGNALLDPGALYERDDFARKD